MPVWQTGWDTGRSMYHTARCDADEVPHSHQSSKAMQTGMVLYFPEPFSIHFVLGGNVYLAVLVGGLPYIFCSFIILIHFKGE